MTEAARKRKPILACGVTKDLVYGYQERETQNKKKSQGKK